MKNTVQKHPEHPRGTCGNLSNIRPKSILGVTGLTVEPPVRNTTINHPADHKKQEEEVAHKVSMVACTYTVTHPRAMMVELRYAAVAHTTMFGPHWFPYQTGTAEYTEVQTSCLCKFNYCLCNFEQDIQFL